MAALARAEAQLTLPRGREEQAVPVEAPAAEYASHFQPVDGRQRILSVDADLVLSLAHSGRLAPPKTTMLAGIVLAAGGRLLIIAVQWDSFGESSSNGG
jgi:hypothetical protein